MRTPHTSTFKGKRVRVKMKDGLLFVAKYKETKSRYVYFLDHERVIHGDILSFTINK